MLVVDKERGHAHLTWEQDSHVRYARWDGEQWIVDESFMLAGDRPAIAVDSDGNPHIAYVNLSLSEQQLQIYYCARGPQGWGLPRLVCNTSGISTDPDIALIVHGDTHVVWAEKMAEDMRVYHAISSDSGDSWSSVQPIPDAYGYAPALALSPQGALWVAWQQQGVVTGLAEAGSQVYVSRRNGDQWSTPSSLTEEVPGDSRGPDIVCDSGGQPHVIWEADHEELAVLYATSDGETWTVPEKLSPEGSAATRPYLAIGPDDMLHAAWDAGATLAYRQKQGTAWSALDEIATHSAGIRDVTIAADGVDIVLAAWGQRNSQGVWEMYSSRLIVAVDETPTPTWTPTQTHTAVPTILDPTIPPNPTATETPAPSETPTETSTVTPSPTETQTHTTTPTRTRTSTPTRTATVTPTPTGTPTLTPSATIELTNTPSKTPTATASATTTQTPEHTPTHQLVTPSHTPSPSLTPRRTATSTPTPTKTRWHPAQTPTSHSSTYYMALIIGDPNPNPAAQASASDSMGAKPVRIKDAPSQAALNRETPLVPSAAAPAAGAVSSSGVSAVNWSWSSVDSVSRSDYASRAAALAITSDGTAYAVWEEPLTIGGALLYYSIKRDGVWSEAMGFFVGEEPDLLVDNNDQVHMVYSNEFAGKYDIYHTVWADSNWEPPENVSNTSGTSTQPAIAIKGDGTLLVVWTDTTEGHTRIYHGWKSNGIWCTYFIGTTSGGSAPDIAVGKEGRVWITWHVQNHSSQRFEIWAVYGDGIEWAGFSMQLSESPMSDCLTPELVGLSSEGTFIVWQQDGGTTGDVYYSDNLDAPNRFWWIVPEEISQSEAHAERPSIAASDSGDVHVGWAEGGDVLHRYRFALGDWETEDTVASIDDSVNDVKLASGPGHTISALWAESDETTVQDFHHRQGDLLWPHRLDVPYVRVP